MKFWEERGINLLEKTLSGTPFEINELDWKMSLTNNEDSIPKHLSAFANLPSGGYMVFGINDSAELANIDRESAESIINKIGSISHSALEPPVNIESAMIAHNGYNLLMVYINESKSKPVYIKREAFSSHINVLRTKQ